MLEMDHFSSIERVFGSFALDLAMYGHQFDRLCLQGRRRQIEERDRREAEVEAEQMRKEERRAEQQRKSQQQSSASETALRPELLAQQDPMFPLIFQNFANELRPAILKKYPAAPVDKVNKVILAKWATIDPVKKQAFIKKTLRIIQSQRTAPASLSQPKQQDNPSPAQDAPKQGQEQVMVKQEAVQEPATDDRLNQFLNRVSRNVAGMQDERQKEENGEPMEEERSRQVQESEQGQQEESPQEGEQERQKMEED